MEALAVSLYYALFGLLSLHGLHRLTQVLRALRPSPPGPRAHSPRTLPPPAALPWVTVQLPLYNERYVAERLLEACAALRWPHDRLELQVLDDSTDSTTEIVAAKVRELRARGLLVEHVRRSDRHGFKAGALAFGLRGGEGHEPARGAFVAVFDADFVPAPDFLERCLPPLLGDPGLGLVQARWGHLNREHSLLTRVQSVFLDAHFGVEHEARTRSGHFLNFNGTAGIWRRSAIEEAGGWSHDTLTEDLDLSFRAQLAGQRFTYLHEVVAPAELPAEMNAFKAQQHRWAKGSIECARKLLPPVWTARGLREGTRLEGAFHLLSNLTYPLVTLLSLLALPITWIASAGRMEWPIWFESYVLGLGLLPVLCFFVLGGLRAGRPLRELLLLLLPAVALGIGIALNQTRAVLEAALGQRSGFVRTPKFELSGRRGSWLGKQYFARRNLWPLAEFALAVSCTAAFSIAVTSGAYALSLFLALFAVGHGWVAAASLAPGLFERLRAKRRERRDTAALSSPDALGGARSLS